MDVKTQILVDELTNDPLTRGYSGMTNAQVVSSLNTVDRSRNKTSLSGDEIFQATDPTQYGALTDTQKSQWLAFCGRDSLDPFATANVTVVTEIFGGGSTTVTNLNSLRTESVSRGEEIGFGKVREGDVQDARRFVV